MILTILAASHMVQEPKPVVVVLQREPTALSFEGNRKNSLMYVPSSVKLAPDKGAGITKEPKYTGAPLYGEVSVGNGPANSFRLVIDQQEGAGVLYVDLNRNGNFTDDPAPEWRRIEPQKEGQMPSYQGTIVFPASYKSAGKVWTAPYGLNFYWAPGRTQLNYYRAGWSTGVAQIGGQRVTVKLLENGNDGVFDKRFDTSADPITLKPVTAYLNEIPKDMRGTFEFEGINYLASIAPDGSKMTLTPTMRVVKAPPRPEVARKELLAPGTPAPDFTVEPSAGSDPVRLSDYKGKVVVLKFWATWCGPCIASMPHFEKLYKKTHPQGVELLAVCVSDERPAFKAWLKTNQANYTYPFFFDPAGKAPNQSISGRLYNVSGIPTVFVIDKEGKVAASIVGYSEGDTRVDQALEKLGVTVK